MGLYTSIYLTPVDSRWIASPEVIRAFAGLLRVTTFDIFTVSRETVLEFDTDDDAEDRFEEVLLRYNVAIDEALGLHQAGYGYLTHMMFPFGDFMKELTAEVQATISEALSDGFIPWDTSIYNGHWSVFSYDKGTIEDTGAFAISISANGCPVGLDLYLQQFLAVEKVREFKGQIESLAQQPFRAIINLT